MSSIESLPANMKSKVRLSESGCWEWSGAQTRTGYGSVGVGGTKTSLAHRASYIATVGSIAHGRTLDHLCRNRLCVNPGHLEVVTRAENSRRRHAAQTHCKNGHELSGDNLKITTRRDGYDRRVCVTCQRNRNRAWMANRRAQSPVATFFGEVTA